MFYDNLKAACKSNKTSVTAVLKALKLGPANGTNWKNGTVPTSDIVVQLSEFLDVSTDFLLTGKSPQTNLPDDETKLLAYYKALDLVNKVRVVERAETLAELAADQAKEVQTIVQSPPITQSDYISVRFIDLPVSAGFGEDLFDDLSDDQVISVPDTPTTRGADYALKILGDSMEPEYHDGDIVFVKQCECVDLGQIGIFVLNGKGYIKRLGKGRLISLNPEYDDIALHDYDRVDCKGLATGTL